MDHSAKAKKLGKPRIPDHLRRRALVSCDRCKKRRIRCLRSSGTDTRTQEACQSCVEVGAKCESTLPRKTRIYGSVETLSARYRALDTLIKGLFPTRDTNDIDELYDIAKAHNIELPAFNEQEVTEEVFSSNPPKPTALSPQQSAGDAESPSVASKESEGLNQRDGTPTMSVEEKLVPMPQGHNGKSHYIGPSSSFGFVLTVRKMVAEFNTALKTIQPDDERTKVAHEFAGSTWSKALDPIVKDESEDSSDGNIDRQVSESSSTGKAVNHRQLPSGSMRLSSSTSRSKRATTVSFLPKKEVTDTFVEAFFNHVHPNYLLFHPPTFQTRYEFMWNQPHVLMRDTEPGWICCLFMMIVFGAQALENENTFQSKQIQHHYLDLVQSRMHQLISATTLINVQALLLLQLYQHHCTERNSAFMLLGCASRMAMALGMHREGTSIGFHDLEKEVRKRVWWTAYVFEQYQCAILGRPCAIEEAEVNVSFPDEVILDGGESVPSGYMEHSVRLVKLLSEIRRKIYAVSSGPLDRGDSPKAQMAIQFLLDLDTWHNSLPQQLRIENLSPLPKHRRAVILLHVQLHHARSLVTRPFMLRKVGLQLARHLGRHVRSQELDKDEMRLSSACSTFSESAAKLLHQLLVDGSFEGVAWLDGYYVFISIFLLALDFFARPWDQKDSGEDLARKQIVRDVMGALENVRICPTFTILTQVALQMAKIVGIFDARSEQHEKAEEFRQYMEQQSTTFTFDYGPQGTQPGAVNALDSWFQRAPVDLPWDLKDFFGGDGYLAPVTTATFREPAMAFESTYNNVQPIIDNSLMVPPPPGAAYTHWAAIDTPFAQQQRDGQQVLPNQPYPHSSHHGMG
ncbi:putative transcriptional regulatory protein [Lachnellula willkommii]|uniref:Putative transcriptional regulatory protein n=1 Tax=Lachnellula willkommii TaxID=215461 RepID=A0A559M2X4_9HELO|nr:putative transcriptional regulatory protein [Lachnellula willkommii]